MPLSGRSALLPASSGTADLRSPAQAVAAPLRRRLHRNRLRFKALVLSGALFVWRADLAGRMLEVRGWQQLTGEPDGAALGRGCLERVHPEDRVQLDFRGRDILDSVTAEVRILDRDGQWRWMRGRGLLLPPDATHDGEWVGVLEDIHDERLALERLRYLAERDPLTGLQNRRSLHEHLREMRERGRTAQVLALDVDDFKLINDRWGHHAGDQFLVALSQALLAVAPPGALCSRQGGDEFCLVIATEAEVAAFCTAVRQIAADGLEFAGLTCHPGCSIGVATFDPHDPYGADTALRQADLAMYAAKAQKGGGACHFDPRMQQAAKRRASIMQALPAACRRDQLFLEYQPIVSTGTGNVEAVEALVRWNHPTLGRIEPSTFIGLAEHSGDIQPLGEWILTQACSDLRCMPPQVTMNINLSARQILKPHFPEMASRIVARHGFAPERIAFEMTETVNAGGERISAEVASLRGRGFRLLIDDFGTQYAFVDLLRSRLFHGVKLPRDLVVGAGGGEDSPGSGQVAEAAILHHLARLCRDLGMGVVAEGVESEADLAAVRAAGIPQAQGYHFAMPMRLLTAMQALWPAPPMLARSAG